MRRLTKLVGITRILLRLIVDNDETEKQLSWKKIKTYQQIENIFNNLQTELHRVTLKNKNNE